MTTTTTNPNTTTTTTRPATRSHRLRRIALAAGFTAAFAGTAVLAVDVLRDDSHRTTAVVVPGPYNGLPNLNDLGVNPVPSPTIVVAGPYNGLPNLRDLGVTIPTVAAGSGR